MKRILSIFCVCMCLTSVIWGQNAVTTRDLPYLCDFEDPTECAAWKMNPGVDLISTNNEWIIGDAIAYASNKSLYVSSDGGQTTSYAATNNVVIAYRDVSLMGDTYDIAFDWRGMGNGTKGYLKVLFCGLRESDIKCLGNSAEPNWVMQAVPCMGQNASLTGADDWQHVQTTFRINRMYHESTETRILFVWVNTDESISNPSSVAIDNIQIAKSPISDYPKNLRVSTSLSSVLVHWDGNADGYEVLYRKKGETLFSSVTTDTTFVSLRNMEYGAYEFWIRGVYADYKTVYMVYPKVYLYETDCFDALNMYGAKFEYGVWSSPTNVTLHGTDMLDYGAASIRSRHTTHFDRNEIDPRTVTFNNRRDTIAKLHTVPQGKYGSVRVGNWDSGAQYESITYSYQVESNANALLLLQYAIVLENPNHDAKSQPRFTLNITDRNGNSIDTKCAYVDFHAPTAEEWEDPEVKKLWHQTTWQDKDVHWQDWNTIGISLDDYIGEELFVTFTAYDCSQGAHFGYAYFTLGCSRTDVDGLPWGDEAQAQMFTVPDGFRYAWFNTLDSLFVDTISTQREFPVLSSDTNTYVCHVTYLSNDECGFELEATAKPHNLIAEIQWEWVPANCQNGIIVKNACHVGLTNQLTGEVEHRYDKRSENCKWTLPDGSATNELHYDGFYVPVSNDGDTLSYAIWTGIYVNDSLFQDSTELTIIVPKIAPIETYLDTIVCYGSEVEFPVGSGRLYNQSGLLYDSLVSVITGCDSVVVFNLEVLPLAQSTVYDTICTGYSYSFAGREYTQPGEYTSVLSSASAFGCDSICRLYLTVAEKPVVTLMDQNICGNDSLLFQAEYSEWVDSFKVIVPNQGEFTFLGRTPELTFAIAPNQIRANHYQAQVVSYMSWCDAYTDTCSFTINLPNNIVVAKFNDVLAILNERYNGGYEFASFQWYANGQMIEGATGSNYYDPNMDETVEYSVAVELVDGVDLWICPFSFASQKDSKSELSPTAKVVKRGSQLAYQTDKAAKYAWYAITGQCVGQGEMHEARPYVEAPHSEGWFILHISQGEQDVVERIIVL